jgi:site-specific recombinase XerD
MHNQSPTDLFLSRLAKTGRRSLRSQLTVTAQLLEWPNEDVENLPFHQLNYAQIEAIKRQRLDDNKSARTINLMLFALKSIVKTGFLMGLVEDMQWRQVQAIARLSVNPSNRGKALVPTSVNQLIEYCFQDKRLIGIRDTCILALLLSTGLRRFELSHLTIDDIQLDDHLVIVKSGKGKKPRQQPLPLWTEQYISLWLEARQVDTGYLFNPVWVNFTKTDKRLSCAAIYQVVKARTLAATGIDISPHDLRRTYITELLNQKVDLSTASKLAGHANITTTQIYDKRNESVMRDAVALLDYKTPQPGNDTKQ